MNTVIVKSNRRITVKLNNVEAELCEQDKHYAQCLADVKAIQHYADGHRRLVEILGFSTQGFEMTIDVTTETSVDTASLTFMTQMELAGVFKIESTPSIW